MIFFNKYGTLIILFYITYRAGCKAVICGVVVLVILLDYLRQKCFLLPNFMFHSVLFYCS